MFEVVRQTLCDAGIRESVWMDCFEVLACRADLYDLRLDFIQTIKFLITQLNEKKICSPIKSNNNNGRSEGAITTWDLLTN